MSNFVYFQKCACVSVSMSVGYIHNIHLRVFRGLFPQFEFEFQVQGQGVFPVFPFLQTQQRQCSLTKFRVRRLGKLHIYVEEKLRNRTGERDCEARMMDGGGVLGHFALESHFENTPTPTPTPQDEPLANGVCPCGWEMREACFKLRVRRGKGYFCWVSELKSAWLLGGLRVKVITQGERAKRVSKLCFIFEESELECE